MKAVELINVTYKYDRAEKPILYNKNLEIMESTITGIFGDNGSGKSTLLRIIAGLIPKVYGGNLTGSVKIFNERIEDLTQSQLSQTVGIIFQNPVIQLISSSVEDELAFGPENLCLPREEIIGRMEHSMRLTGITDIRHDNPAQLSGGQQQLVALASILTMKPRLLICDEIMAWLDDDYKSIVMRVLKELGEDGTTIIMADHRIENLEIASNIIKL